MKEPEGPGRDPAEEDVAAAGRFAVVEIPNRWLWLSQPLIPHGLSEGVQTFCRILGVFAASQIVSIQKQVLTPWKGSEVAPVYDNVSSSC